VIAGAASLSLDDELALDHDFEIVARLDEADRSAR
jgi:hypothetical protein